MPSTATSTATTIVAWVRGRPGTTRQYTAPTRKNVNTKITTDGAEYPPESPMIRTPYGRGRDRGS